MNTRRSFIHGVIGTLAVFLVGKTVKAGPNNPAFDQMLRPAKGPFDVLDGLLFPSGGKDDRNSTFHHGFFLNPRMAREMIAARGDRIDFYDQGRRAKDDPVIGWYCESTALGKHVPYTWPMSDGTIVAGTTPTERLYLFCESAEVVYGCVSPLVCLPEDTFPKPDPTHKLTPLIRG